MKAKKKVLAIASAGGHWIQLLRLKDAFEECDVTYMSTKKSFASMVPDNEFIYVPDASRWNKLGLIKISFLIFSKIFLLKPDIIITTGAAPGLIGLISGKLLFKKTIWIDSIANVQELSLSGKIATIFATRVYTQWPQLVSKKVIFKGNILS